jgi:hypothetical protein
MVIKVLMRDSAPTRLTGSDGAIAHSISAGQAR